MSIAIQPKEQKQRKMKYANLCIIQDSEGEENEGQKKIC